MFDIYIDRNKKYKVDDLYQWDTKVGLNIHGLNLVRAPEIHFSNSGLKEAIVKQSTMDTTGVISVQVPDSVLQVNGNLDVYIYAYELDESRTLYKLTISVIGRKKPADYIAEDDEKIYSYNALENKLDNTVVELTRANEEALAEVDRKLDEFSKEIVDSLEIVKQSAEAVASLQLHLEETDNPHNVTAQQVGAPTVKQFDDHTKAYNAHVEDFNDHTADKTNPHAVTASQVGAPTTETFNSHVNNKNNPHGVTDEQVGAIKRKGYGGYNGNVDELKTAGGYLVLGNCKGTFPPNNSANYWYSVEVFAGGTGAYTQLWMRNRGSGVSAKVYVRHFNGANWDNYIEVADVASVLPITGGTLTGQIRINMSNTADIPQIQLLNTANDKTARVELSTTGSLQLWTQAQSGGTNNSTYLRIGAQDIATENALMLNRRVDGKNTLYNVYGTNNITCGTTDLTAGTSALANDCYYDVYE